MAVMSAVVVSVGDLPLRQIGVLPAQHVRHVLQAQPVAVQLRRIDLHAHRGQRAAAHAHLSHALNLRKPLLHDRRSRVVQRPAVVDCSRSAPES